MDQEKIRQAILEKTGFPFENYVAGKFRDCGWTTITSRYYIDDVEGTAREIDLLVYKAKKVEDILYYTVVIVSCKRSTEHGWVFLTREINKNDPNINLHPLKIWTNNKIINFMVNGSEWRESYLKKDQVLYGKAFKPSADLFAFQEVKEGKDSGETTVKIDRDKLRTSIFSAISSLMKAENHEIESLPDRKKEEVFYNFNLLSIADVETFQLYFDEGSPTPTMEKLANGCFIHRYIINKQDTISRIRFIVKEELESAIVVYNELHTHNLDFFHSLKLKFYENVINSYDRQELILPDFKNNILASVPFIISREISRKLKLHGVSLWENQGILEVDLSISDEAGDDLGEHTVSG